MTENRDDNIVFVGSKPFMNYIVSVQFITQSKPEVTIKARGKFITKAVDIAEVAKRKKNLEVRNIRISSEEFENKESCKVNVSTIEITLSKKQSS